MEKLLSCFVIQKIHVCIIVTWEICDTCEEALMCNAADIQSTAICFQDICQSIHGRKLLGFFDQADEKLCFHNAGIHINILVFLVTMVGTDGLNTLLTVQLQNITGEICFLCIINCVIKHGNICTGFDMCMYKLVKINRINHIAGSNNNIWLVHSAQRFHIIHIAGNIGIINIIIVIVLREQKLKSAAL